MIEGGGGVDIECWGQIRECGDFFQNTPQRAKTRMVAGD